MENLTMEISDVSHLGLSIYSIWIESLVNGDVIEAKFKFRREFMICSKWLHGRSLQHGDPMGMAVRRQDSEENRGGFGKVHGQQGYHLL